MAVRQFKQQKGPSLAEIRRMAAAAGYDLTKGGAKAQTGSKTSKAKSQKAGGVPKIEVLGVMETPYGERRVAIPGPDFKQWAYWKKAGSGTQTFNFAVEAGLIQDGDGYILYQIVK